MILAFDIFKKYGPQNVFAAFMAEGYDQKGTNNLINKIDKKQFSPAEKVLLTSTINFYQGIGDSEMTASVKALLKIAQKRNLVKTLKFKF